MTELRVGIARYLGRYFEHYNSMESNFRVLTKTKVLNLEAILVFSLDQISHQIL